MLKPTHNLLPNQVQFLVSPQMTKFDVQQYLEKIYKVPVVNVAVYNHIGKSRIPEALLFNFKCHQIFEFPVVSVVCFFNRKNKNNWKGLHH